MIVPQATGATAAPVISLEALRARFPDRYNDMPELTTAEADRVQAWLYFEPFDAAAVADGISSGKDYTEDDVKAFTAAYIRQLQYLQSLSNYNYHAGGLITQTEAAQRLLLEVLTNPALSLLESQGYTISEAQPGAKTYYIEQAGVNVSFN